MTVSLFFIRIKCENKCWGHEKPVTRMTDTGTVTELFSFHALTFLVGISYYCDRFSMISTFDFLFKSIVKSCDRYCIWIFYITRLLPKFQSKLPPLWSLFISQDLVILKRTMRDAVFNVSHDFRNVFNHVLGTINLNMLRITSLISVIANQNNAIFFLPEKKNPCPCCKYNDWRKYACFSLRN